MKAYERAGLILAMVMILTLVNVHTGVVLAVDNEVTRSTLAGLKGIYLQVPSLSSQTEELGLTARQIQRAAEKQLDRAGIPLLSDTEYDRLRYSRRYPLARLEILVSAYQLKELNLIIYNVTVQTRQTVYLARKPVVRMVASTWSKQEFGHSVNLDIVRGKIQGLLDDFIDAYLSVNSE